METATMEMSYVAGTLETMTLNQLTAKLRAHGMKISDTVVGDYIIAGKFPFADGIARENGRHFIIYEKLFNDWLDERLIKGGSR